MIERLDKLCLLPPPADTPWSGSPTESTRCEINRDDGQRVEIDVPLFWYDPPWYQLSTDTADQIAVAIGQQGVLVSALRSDLSGPDQQPEFHDPESNEEQDDSTPLPRIVPYRPERYGLSDQDFDGARIIDLRLTMNRDESGRFAFPPEQIERWEATPPSTPVAGGSWVPSATFPPDVVSMQHLSSKLKQLRLLSPTAAVFVSLGPYRLDEELTEIVAARPDGLILRLDELELDGLKLALLTRHARHLADQAGAQDLPLWIVPGDITPDDAVKLLALGASGVAIDNWCAEIIDGARNESQASGAPRHSTRRSSDEDLTELVEEELALRVERFKGLFNSIQYSPPAQRLASSSETWARALGIRSLSLSSVSTQTSAKSRKQ
jgi:hypothetical protein